LKTTSRNEDAKRCILGVENSGMSYNKLREHREVWKKKEILRRIYLDWYKLIMAYAKEGKIVELGSGSGNLSEYYPDIISSDIIPCPWLDIAFDVTRMPFKEESIDTLIMIDLLHHLEDVSSFFEEVERVLKDKGRLIMLEPYISPFSFLIYNYLHQESVIFNIDVFAQRSRKDQDYKKDPFEANSAVPTIIFWREPEQFSKRYPQLRIMKKSLLSFLLYPLSGGFEHRSLIPMCGVGIVRLIERLMSPLAKLLAFRTFIAIEKLK
jgi:SAM-dependent methyltransferase